MLVLNHFYCYYAIFHLTYQIYSTWYIGHCAVGYLCIMFYFIFNFVLLIGTVILCVYVCARQK